MESYTDSLQNQADSLPAAGVRAAGANEGGSSSLSLRVLKATDRVTSSTEKRVKWTRGQCVEAINKQVRQFVEFHGINYVGMATFTTADIPTVKVFYLRWHNFTRRGFLKVCPSGNYIAVLEFQKRGAPHLHVLFAVAEDIRTGVKWYNSKGQLHPVVDSCGCHLMAIFDQLRDLQPAYGFGSWVSVQPLRTIEAAVADYVSKYLWKGDPNTPDNVGRVRRVRYGNKRNWDGFNNQRFSWLYGRSWAWRKGVAKFAEVEGRKYADRREMGNGEIEEFVASMTQAKLRMILGPRWCYHHRDEIIKCFYMSVICDIENIMPEPVFNQLWSQGRLNEFLDRIDQDYVLKRPDYGFADPPGENRWRKELDIHTVDRMHDKPLCLSRPGPVWDDPVTVSSATGPAAKGTGLITSTVIEEDF